MRLFAALAVVTMLASTVSAPWSYRDPNARTPDARMNVKAPPPRTASGTLRTCPASGRPTGNTTSISPPS
jgi:hypothetical protein